MPGLSGAIEYGDIIRHQIHNYTNAHYLSPASFSTGQQVDLVDGRDDRSCGQFRPADLAVQFGRIDRVEVEHAEVVRHKQRNRGPPAQVCRLVEGEVAEGSLMAGQSVGAVTKIQPLREILQDLVNEADSGLEKIE